MKGKWYQQIFQAIANGFSKFIGIFKRNGFIYSLATMMVFLSAYAFVLNPVSCSRIYENSVEWVYEYQKTKQNEKKIYYIEKRYKADEIVGGIMVEAIDKFECIQRILLLEKHNSVQSLSGVDFLYLTCSMEMLTPNSRHLNYLSEDLQRQIVVNLMGNDMITTLKHRDYLYYPDVASCNHPQHRLIHKLQSAGDKECLIIPFKDANNRPLLLFVVTGENLDVEGITKYIDRYSNQIKECLL